MGKTYRTSVATLLVLLCAGGYSHPVRADIYNVQSILATEAEEGLSGSISASLDYRKGNVDYLFVGATPLARFRSGNHLLIGIARSEHKTSRGDTILSRSLEHLRYRYQVSQRLLGEVFTQHEYDAIKRLQLRALVGMGPRVDLAHSKSYSLGLGVAYMLEYERLQNDGEVDGGTSDFQHRNSTYLVAQYQLDDRVQLVATMYLQPRLTGASDTRLLSDTQATFEVTKRLSFTTAFSIAYDSRPPESIKRLDTALISTMTLSL